MTTQPTISEETIAVWDGRITMRVKVAGRPGSSCMPLVSVAERFTLFSRKSCTIASLQASQ